MDKSTQHKAGCNHANLTKNYKKEKVNNSCKNFNKIE